MTYDKDYYMILTKKLLSMYPYIISSRLAGSVSLSDTYLDLERYLETLTKKEKELINIRYMNGYSVEETAVIFKTSPGTISKYTNKIAYKIAEIIESEELQNECIGS